MERKKQRIALVVCVALFVAAGILSAVFSQDDTVSWEHDKGGLVVVSEIMSSNRTYPAPDGQYLDFIEIRNLSASPVDVSGYMLSDTLNAIGYTFPDGTILPGYGYAVCWCNKNAESEAYASFGISRDGDETIYLYNDAKVMVDEIVMPAMEANTSLVRQDDASWAVSAFATPGYANTQEGYAQWLDAMGAGNVQVAISEVVTNNSCITTADQTVPMDYVELVNLGSQPVQLTGAYLSDDPENPLRWQIPNLTLEAGGRAVVYCAGSGDGSMYAPFGLSKSGCTVTLTGSLGNTLSQVECPSLDLDHAWSLGADGTYSVTAYGTPGFENSDSGYQAWLTSVGLETVQVVISEIMTSNHSTIISAAGTLCDWVELENVGDTTVILDNVFLTDDAEERGKWQIPAVTLAPGQRTVILCAGDSAREGEAGFALSRSAGSVMLCGPQGSIIHQVQYPTMENDRTWALQADGTYLQTDRPSPGYENTDEGYLAYRASQAPAGPLMIGEVMASNDQYMIQSDGKYYDWVELVNISDSTIDLSGYCLSNDRDALAMFQLPSRMLAPGERTVIICSANDQLVGKYIQAPFTLSAEECWVYVSDAQGRICDSIRVADVPSGGSMGRVDGENGTYYFEKPTPGNPSETGVSLISARPKLLTPDGVYENVASVSVRFQGTGTLHYTLDGSEPTPEDPVLSGELQLTESAVVRVVNVEQDKLPSEVATASFIINENHSLSVLSLAVAPEAMFGTDGIYTKNRFDSELPCNLKLFEADGGFTVDCGVELMGNSANDPAKKSFKVNFRSRYGADVLGYPLYGPEGVQVFDALCISAGSDDGQTLFRDELFSQLCRQMDGGVHARDAKFCVLYVNGEYWGVYSLKEALGEMYYSQKADVSEASVEELREPVQWGSAIHELAGYCADNDLSDPVCYEYVASQVDLDSLIDWMIFQGYSCNSNIGENLRYYRSQENGNLWQPVLSDLDGAFYYRDGFAQVFAPDQPWSYLKLTNALIQNPDFRARFLQRLQTLSQSVLGSQNVVAAIDSLEALLEQEMQRETERWGGSLEVWRADVERLRTFIVRYDHWALLADSLKTAIGLTDAEVQQYF